LLGGNSAAVAGAGKDHPQEDVFRIPKSLKPGDAEPYPVSELSPAEAAAAKDPDVTRAGTGPTVPPDLTPDQLLRVKVRIRHLNEKKDEFTKALDFGLAEKCRDEADALGRLLVWYEWGRRPR
jgi:hypothetical protein